MERNEQRFRSMIYELLDEMKNGTLEKLLASDEQYQYVARDASKLDSQYRELELSDYTETIVSGLLKARDTENYYYSLNAYLAGVLDAPRIGKEFGVDLFRNIVR